MNSRTSLSEPNKPPTWAPDKPLSGFARLTPAVSLYEPLPSAGALGSDSNFPPPPTTILLCSWMNARPKNIAYYISQHIANYPHARIVLVTINTAQFLFQSEARRRQDVQAAVDALLARDQKNEKILVHAFSNGGGKRLYGITGVYRDATGEPFAPEAVILDSAPGIPGFHRDLYALMLPLRKLNWFLWLPLAAAILAVVSVLYVSVHWMPKWFWRELVWGPAEGLNDVKLLSSKSVRGYIYSVTDKAIYWRDVEKHASDAESKGFQVLKEKIEDAEHAQLFKGNGGEKRYWGFVQEIWKLGQRSS